MTPYSTFPLEGAQNARRPGDMREQLGVSQEWTARLGMAVASMGADRSRRYDA